MTTDLVKIYPNEIKIKIPQIKNETQRNQDSWTILWLL